MIMSKRARAVVDGSRLQQRVAPELVRRNVLYEENYRILREIALSRFDWRGLPETVSEAYMEEQLLVGRTVIAFVARSKAGAPVPIALPATGHSPDIYGEPTVWQARGYGGRGLFRVRRQDAAVVHPSVGRTAEVSLLEVHAHRLAELDRTFEVNSSNARRPRVLTGAPNQELSLRNISGDIDDSISVIGARGTITEGLTSLDLGVSPDQLLPLQQARERVMGEALVALGIDYVADRDRDRLVSDEAGALAGHIEANRRRLLAPRQRAAAAMTRLFGSPVSVSFRRPDDNVAEGLDGIGYRVAS